MKLFFYQKMRCRRLIIQISPMHSGSTLLVNAIIGSLFSGQAVHYSWKPFTVPCNHNIIKTHDNYHMKRIKDWMSLNKHRNTTFISSSRQSINQTVLTSAPNHLVFDYSDIVRKNFCSILNAKIKGNTDACTERIRGMNYVNNYISKLPFSYAHPYYALHGSHKNRTLTTKELLLR